MLQLVHSLSKFHLTVVLLNLCVPQSEVFVRGESSQMIDSSHPWFSLDSEKCVILEKEVTASFSF